MDRREFLASGAVAAMTAVGGCAGCAQTPTRIALSPETDAGIAERVVGSTAPFGAEAGSVPADATNDLAARVIENGPTQTTAFETPPVPVWSSADGRVYWLSAEPVALRPAVVYRVTLDGSPSLTPSSDEAVSVEALPEPDRRALRAADVSRPPSGERTYRLPYRPERTSESRLVPEPDVAAVVWDDQSAGVRVGTATSGAFTTYRIEAEQVTQAATFGARVRRKIGFRMAGLPDDQREILSDAVVTDGGGYVRSGDRSLPNALRRLAGRFTAHTRAGSGRVPSETSGYVLRWDDRLFWASAQFAFREVLTERGEG